MKTSNIVSIGILVFASMQVTKAEPVTFSVELTAKGEETVEYEDREFTGNFPYFDVRGGTFGGWPRRTETVTFCLPAEVARDCDIDTTKTHSTYTPEGPLYGQGGPGFGIYINTVNSPGGAQNASYNLNITNGCLTSEVTVRAKRRSRGWYQGSHVIYARCPVKAEWTHTQLKGPYTIDSTDGYNQVTQYDGQIGSANGVAGTAVVYDNDEGYKAIITNTSPANAHITNGMYQFSPNHGANGRRFFATYQGNDIFARALELTQGVQNLHNDMPLVGSRRTMARFFVQSTLPAGNVNAELRAYRNGIELAESPLSPENTIAVRATGIDRMNLDHAFLFKLPHSWTTGGSVQFRAKVNPNFSQPDSNTTNNQWIEDVVFSNPKIDTVVEVPLHLHDGADRDGALRIYESSNPHYQQIMGHVVRHQPTSQLVSYNCGFKPLKPLWHFWPFNKEWDIRKDNHWSQILSKMAWKRFWSNCGYNDSRWSGMVHPLLPEATGSAVGGKARKARSVQASLMYGVESYTDWFNSRGGSIVSHEIGHLKGLNHVCEVNSPANIDNNYPYNADCNFSFGNPSFFTNGHDGYFSLDVYHDYFGIENPTVISNESNNTTVSGFQRAFPLLSYANSKRWLSPYSYCKLLNKQGVSCNTTLIAGRYKNPDAFFEKESIALTQRVSNLSQASLNPYYKGDLSTALAKKSTDTPITNKLPIAIDGVDLDLGSVLVVSGVLNKVDNTVDDFILMKTNSLLRPTSLSITQNDEILDDLSLHSEKSLTNLTALVLKQYKKGLLLRQNFISLDSDNESITNDYLAFLQMAPLATGADKFELVLGSQILITKEVSANSPSINLLPIVNTNVANDTVISWEASDLDNDELSYSIFYSYNNGLSWILVDAEVTETSYDLAQDVPASVDDPLKYYRGTNAGKFKVMAFDGYHTTSAITDELLVIPGAKPQVNIMQKSGHIATQGETVYLTGAVTDIEDGPLRFQMLNSPFTLEWSSSIDGNIGSDLEIRKRNLSPGEHTITLNVTDSDGMIGTSSMQLIIERKVDPIDVLIPIKVKKPIITLIEDDLR